MKLVRNYVCLAVLFIALAGCDTNSREELSTIVSPLPAIELKAETKKVDTNHAQQVVFDNGFSVTVPKRAFVDKQGNSVKGEVDLSLKVFDNPASIMASGIPMHYEDENQSGTFMSAGMFDIRARVGGTEVELAKGQELQVLFPTKVKGDYDFFQFVTGDKPDEGKWVREELSFSPPDVELPKSEQSFKLQWNTEEFHALAAFDTVFWNPATPYRNPSTGNNKWVLDTKWDAFRISRPSHGLKDAYHSSGKHLEVSTAYSKFLDDNIDYAEYPETSHELDSLGNTMFRQDNSVHFYDKQGNKIGHFTPNDEAHQISYCSMINGTVYVSTSGGDYVVKDYGKETYFFEGESIHDISENGALVITRLTGDFDNYYLNDLAGEPLEIFKAPNKEGNWGGFTFVYDQVFFTKNYVVNKTAEGFQVHDMKGEFLYKVERSFSYLTHLIDNQLILVEDKSLSVFNLDSKKEVKQSLDPVKPQNGVSGKRSSETDYHPPLVLVAGRIPAYASIYFSIFWGAFDKQYMLWNYEEGKVTEFGFIGYPFPYDNPRFVLGTDDLDSVAVLYDLKLGKEIYKARVEKSRKVTAAIAGEKNLSFDEIQDRILLSVGENSKLLTMEGEVVVDFNAFSSDLAVTGVVENEIIVTYTNDGTYTTWSLEGEVLSTTHVSTDFESNMSVNDQNFLAFSSVPKVTWVFDKWGELKIDAAAALLTPVTNSELSVLSYGSGDDLVEPFELPDGALQLTLTKGNLEFVTYVTLTEGVGDLLPAYQEAFLDRMNQKRKNIEKAVNERRRLNINSMGIYNCDILLRVPDALVFAATFELEGESIAPTTRLYHMLDTKGIAISEVSTEEIKEFPIDPNDSHRFIAILPDGRIGLLDFDDTALIDWAAVKEQGAYTFNLKLQDRDFDSLADLNWLFSSQ